MSIWHYEADRLANPALGQDAVVALYMKARNADACPYCTQPLRKVVEQHPDSDDLVREHGRILRGDLASTLLGGGIHATGLDPAEKPGGLLRRYGRHSRNQARPFEHHLRVCPVCGWWVHFQELLNLEGDESEHTINTYGGVAALKLFDLTDVNAPLSDVRAFLAARYDRRFSLNARLFEETVADVFRGLGYHARVTAYSGDDGIDVVLDGPENTTIGIQVKRYRNRIKVAQIRELTGALVLAGITRGIFVTTSDFERGGERTARLSADAGVPIELFNAERFYDALRLRQLASTETLDTIAERLSASPPRLIHSQRSRMRTRFHNSF